MSTSAELSDAAPVDPAHCPQCSRFVGPYARCPYCGARLRQRISIRVVKLMAVALATVGLFGLWWVARSSEIPLVATADMVDTMNMAYVRVQGRISRALTYDPESGYLGFWVSDATGEVHIVAYQETTAALLDANRIPALGDEVSVAGTLRVRDDYAAITLNIPDHLTLTRPTAVALDSGRLTVLDEGRRVRLSGEVVAVRTPYAGMTLITLQDASGEIVVAVDETLATLTGPLPSLQPGQGIQVEGAVSLYRGSPQIVPAATGDIVITAAPPEPPVAMALESLSDLEAAQPGQSIRLRGQVVLLEGLKGGVKATLDDGTDQIVVVVWDSVFFALENPRALDIGAELEVQGVPQIYEGELELIPESVTDLTILQPAPPLPWVTIGQLSAQDAGRIVRIRGVLQTPSGFSSGVKVGFTDGTGKITVLLWSSIYEQLNPAPTADMRVEISGLVSEYRGSLELIPRSPLDWQIAEW